MGALVKDASGRVRSGWVVAAFAACALLVYLALMAAVGLLGLYPRAPVRLDDPRLFFSSAAALAAGLAATLVCRVAFGARAGADPSSAARGGLLGLGLGAVAISAVVLLGAAAGGSLEASGAPARELLRIGALQLLTVGPTSVGEELLLRGVAFRQLARGLSPGAAIVASGGAFGLMHLGNPSVSWLAALNIALVGCWFGLVVWRTGTLWTSIGLHLAWNWFEGFVFGLPVSGVQPAASLVRASAPPGFFSGGAFGPEASGSAALVLALAIALTLFWPRREEPKRSIS